MSGYAPLTDTTTGRVSHWNATEAAAHVNPRNIGTRFRETFEKWPSEEWTQTVSPGDIVTVDGNAMGASYLVISMDPLSVGTETHIDTVDSFNMPVEIAVGAHASQVAWGQDLSIEFLDREFVEDVPDLEISSIAQTTSTLTVDTALPHGLAVGKRIGIRGCSNNIANYPSLVVATITSPTQFTCTGGPNSTIPSQTITNPTGAKGFVYFRPALSRSRNGTAMHVENATATQGFFYARASAGDALPFASGSGNALTARQATTIGTTASVAIAGSVPYTYGFVPTNEYRLTLMADRFQWSDALVDSLAVSNNRVLRTQVVPNPAKKYFLRLKARSEPSLTAPIGQIVSAVKTGTTTATVTMDRPHGLTTGDLVIGYGVRDVASASFPALATAVSATVVDATTFTVVWGTASTVTSYGGFIAKVNAACPLPGIVAQSIQSAVKTTLADGQHQIVLVGSANWSGALIGDYVNIVGVRNIVDGSSLGIDGAWKVANISTTNLTLVNIPGYSPTVADFAVTNCGGGVIKRTDFRISYTRIFDFDRLRVESLPRPSGDVAASAPVVVTNTVPVSGTIAAAGTVAVDTAIGNPVTAGLRASNVNIAAMSAAGDNVGWMGTMIGAGIMRPYSIPEADWQAPAPVGGIANTATPLQVKESAGAGIRNYVTSIDLQHETLTNATDFRVREPDLTCSSQTIASNTLTVSATHNLVVGDAVVFTASTVTGISTGVTYYVLTVPAATTLTLSATRGGSTLAISGTAVTATFHKVLWMTRLGTAALQVQSLNFPTPLRGSVNTALQLQTVTASGAGAVYASLQGYVAP